MAEPIEQIIRSIYASFNKRDIPAALAHMHPDVHWPNGWEGGYVEGHEAVRDYWTRQWKEIDPIVIPVTIDVTDDKVNVTVQQTIKDKKGNLVSDSTVVHSYVIEKDLICSMEIMPGTFTDGTE